MWISADVTVTREGGSLAASLRDIKIHDKEGSMPAGERVNPELANPKSRLRLQAEEFLLASENGKFRFGDMRVMNCGGAIIFNPRKAPFDLSTDELPHETVLERVERRLGSPIKRYTLAVVRDWAAPGSFGVIEGGGAGRGDLIIDSSRKFYLHCLDEMLGEIGLVSMRPHGEYGRVAYVIDDEHTSDRMNRLVIEQWKNSHGGAPAKIEHLCLGNLPLPDMIDAGDWIVDQLKLAFELNNASLESLIRREAEMVHGKLRFIDLECHNGKALNRAIAVVLVGEDPHHTGVVFYRDGVFDPRTPMVSVWGNAISPGNEKFDAIRSLIVAD